MEINYDLIIKYLEKPKVPIFTTPKNTCNYVNTFPSKFKNILCDKIYRYGVITYDNDINISFWSSLLTLLDKDFIIDTDYIVAINKFKLNLLEKYPKKYNIDKNDIKENLKLEVNTIILQYIVDVFDINFIILNFKNEELTAYHKNTEMNPYKPTYIFANYLNLWEPIMLELSTIIREFSYNTHTPLVDGVIKNLVANIKDLVINTNNINNTPLEENNSNLSISKLNKLTKPKLIEMANTLHVKLPENLNKVTKSIIIDLILNHK